MDVLTKMMTAGAYLCDKMTQKPLIGIILGSGLGAIANELTDAVSIPFSDIPYFPVASTTGHRGQFVFGNLQGVPIAVLQGRFHFYEGISLTDVTFPIRVMKTIGISTLILTNACGAVNTTFQPGDLMVISDHLNLVGINPLIGPHDDLLGPRFPDASDIYAKTLRLLAHSVANKNGFSLREGVYAWWSGPTYETPAEIRMIRILGADAVGMSTVPEALVASQMGMKILGISCLTNMATGIRETKLTHQEVLEVAAKTQDKFVGLLRGIINELR
jgi:purine-nucleoside phosphorylase